MFRKATNLIATDKCIRYEIIESLNNTPDIVLDKVHTHSRTGFAYYVKQHLINKYDVNCTITNCYVCSA